MATRKNKGGNKTPKKTAAKQNGPIALYKSNREKEYVALVSLPEGISQEEANSVLTKYAEEAKRQRAQAEKEKPGVLSTSLNEAMGNTVGIHNYVVQISSMITKLDGGGNQSFKNSEAADDGNNSQQFSTDESAVAVAGRILKTQEGTIATLIAIRDRLIHLLK